MTESRSAARRLLPLLIAIAATVLSGCTAAVIGGAAATASVANDRRSTGTFVDDGIIEGKVVDVLMDDEPEMWKQIHINVTSYNNIVLLTGETPAKAQRDRVVDVARNVPKVREVHAELVVASPSSMSTRSSDTWLTGKVKTAMLTKNFGAATHVKVVTERGTVYLMGLVTRAEAEQATSIARTVSGVQRVVKVFEYIDS